MRLPPSRICRPTASSRRLPSLSAGRRVTRLPAADHRRWHLPVGCCPPVSLPLSPLHVGHTPARAGGGDRSPKLHRPVRGPGLGASRWSSSGSPLGQVVAVPPEDTTARSLFDQHPIPRHADLGTTRRPVAERSEKTVRPSSLVRFDPTAFRLRVRWSRRSLAIEGNIGDPQSGATCSTLLQRHTAQCLRLGNTRPSRVRPRRLPLDERSADLAEAHDRWDRARRGLAHHVPMPRYSAACPALRRGLAPDNYALSAS